MVWFIQGGNVSPPHVPFNIAEQEELPQCFELATGGQDRSGPWCFDLCSASCHAWYCFNEDLLTTDSPPTYIEVIKSVGTDMVEPDMGVTYTVGEKDLGGVVGERRNHLVP
ncbi:hypothetical protein G7K_2256-t1 [Saitoella complicata NRRL Y-17804]|uniref:Uncharacterized protein n=1 Tax=Saitoella complicata (strain BCRC 22490 / CBS 7301 / JCM 7358 / NBRC 10748 / NRRL Y-17804) TaxID=698492 RepID=A0A0E9NDZ5_SAICN|nr:hypothetical protein G7K_2256-t1 [Saitoella complicata NRRL Y-17804]